MAPDLDALVLAMIDGDRERSLELADALARAGVSPSEVIVGGVERAMAALDRKCTAEQFNLLEIMLAGRAVMAVVRRMFPEERAIPDPRGTVVVAVLEGDIHDIGKAILKIVLSSSRFRVVDCGKDAPVQAVVGAVAESGASAVCVSGLISSVIPQVRAIKPALARAGLSHVSVLAGGAALKQCSAAALGVDHVGETAFDALAFLDRVSAGSRDASG
jgi:methanogenic corrinoid protein MtbC1